VAGEAALASRAGDRGEVAAERFGFMVEGEVDSVFGRVEGFVRVRLERGEDGAEVVLLGAVLGDEFEGFVVGGIEVKAVDEYAGDFVPGDGAVRTI
jgi:hypothetical protein